MTQEQIEKAALEYAIAEMGLDYIGELDFEKGFVKGVQWRINSIWHDATKYKPILGKRIFADDSIYPWTSGPEIEVAFNTMSVIKWCYVDDIIPDKEGGNQ